ncbi:MAG TPA: hypothetical protein DCE41_06590 [Cytophagales bacterium]|nr:hypothetical protein [Cytophagales bacterium]HAA20897.1 hypothetical protein [Cytophagales bacterium]HAP65203.1 hypothetical protein [Cytophagales bacterium]
MGASEQANLLLVVCTARNGVRVILMDLETFKVIEQESLTGSKNLMEVALADDGKLALLVFETEAVVLALPDFKVINRLSEKGAFLGGDFGEGSYIHFSIPAYSGSVDWAIWNYASNTYNEYPLERYAQYSRGAVLHPSRQLIGACWSAHQCGFLIHVAQPRDEQLHYFEFGEEVQRHEYEAYGLSFSADGSKIAYLTDPYVAGHDRTETLCVYGLDNPFECLFEMKLSDAAYRTVFLGSQLVLVWRRDRSVDVVDLVSSSSIHALQGEVQDLLAMHSTNEFVVAEGNLLKKMSVLNRELMPSAQAMATKFAEAYMQQHRALLSPVINE